MTTDSTPPPDPTPPDSTPPDPTSPAASPREESPAEAPTPDTSAGDAPKSPRRGKLRTRRTRTRAPRPAAAAGRWALLILVPIALVQLAWSRQDFGRVLDHLTNDDTFLYLQVVRNVAEHGHCSFDGVHDTTGIQPLWTAVLVPIAAAVPDDEGFVRAVLAFSVLLNLAAGWLLARTAGGLASSATAGVATALLWAAYQMRMRPALLGMESGLIALTFAGLLAFLVFHPPRALATWRWRLGLAALAALTFLSRVDTSVILAALGVLVVVGLARTGRDVRATAKEAALLAALTLAMVLPYLGFNLVMAGRLMPVSGAVKRSYATQDLPPSGLVSADGARHVVERVVGNVNANLDRVLPVGDLIDEVSVNRFGLAMAAAILLLGCLLLRGPPRGLALALVLGGIVHVVAFAALLGRFSPASWYYVPEYATAALLGGLAAAAVAGAGRPRLRRFVIGALVLLAAFQIWWATARRFPTVERHDIFRTRWEFAQRVRDAVPPDARIGSWNAGQLGYFTHRTVVNLDGLVNDGAYADFLAEGGDVREYLARENITYLADYNARDLSVEPDREWDPRVSFRGLWRWEELEVVRQYGRFYLVRVPAP